MEREGVEEWGPPLSSAPAPRPRGLPPFAAPPWGALGTGAPPGSWGRLFFVAVSEGMWRGRPPPHPVWGSGLASPPPSPPRSPAGVVVVGGRWACLGSRGWKPPSPDRPLSSPPTLSGPLLRFLVGPRPSRPQVAAPLALLGVSSTQQPRRPGRLGPRLPSAPRAPRGGPRLEGFPASPTSLLFLLRAAPELPLPSSWAPGCRGLSRAPPALPALRQPPCAALAPSTSPLPWTSLSRILESRVPALPTPFPGR